MEMKIITVTPKMAKEWLKLNTNNRAVSARHLEHLAQDMRDGRWKLNGDSIRMSDSSLLDGQHRLMACVIANKPFETYVIDGLDGSIFDTIDIGRKRSHSDILSILGEKNCSNLAATLKFVADYHDGELQSNKYRSNIDLQSLLDKYPDIRDFVNGTKNTPLIPFSANCGLHYLFSKKDATLADLFMEQLVTGMNILNNDPVATLRNRLINISAVREKFPRYHIAALIIKTWNATRKGKNIKQICFSDGKGISKRESFPVII